jgi:hypothetical protein
VAGIGVPVTVPETTGQLKLSGPDFLTSRFSDGQTKTALCLIDSSYGQIALGTASLDDAAHCSVLPSWA